MPSGSLRLVVTGAERAILARLAKSYGCDVPELARVAIEELIAAHARPPRTPVRRAKAAPTARPRRRSAPPAAPVASGRVFARKRCASCGEFFALAAFLGRIGDVCLLLDLHCQAWRERLEPASAPPVPDLWPGIVARIQAEGDAGHPIAVVAPPAFQPSECDRAAAALCQDVQKTLFLIQTPGGPILCGIDQRGRA